ncbi:MAG TPA: HD family hydrolase [Bacteroidia bacterium]|nr:HD family hydrolase [Bacteroidia bacterium]
MKTIKDIKLNHIRTFTGLEINVFDPTPEMICIEDIAHALSVMPRFAGHTRQFYSVAQHSYYCSTQATPKNRLKALLHDASEAYMMDMPKPLKNLFPEFTMVEENLMRVIAKKYNFAWPADAELKYIDAKALEVEYNELMICSVPPEKRELIPFSSGAAKILFLNEFKKLTNA